MRPRTELAAAVGLLLVLGIGAAALGSRRARTTDLDPRRSTYLAGPSGARAFAEALGRLDVRVYRSRRPIESLDTLKGRATLVTVLGPSLPLTAVDGRRLAELPVDLLLAGEMTVPAMRCLGYTVVPRRGQSSITRFPGRQPDPAMPRVRAELVHHLARTIVDSSNRVRGRKISCDVPEPVTVDTLLVTASGRLAAVRLTLQGSRRLTLVADDRLFSNRVLRSTRAGPFTLGLVLPRYRRVVFDEYHQGYAASSSLAGAALEWSLHTPVGWAVWQVALVGVLALLAAGIRFGPVREVIERRRRSPLEHVRALAQALAAAQGHDVAVRLMVQGLRRRLSRSGGQTAGDLQAWLDGLRPSIRTSRGREALAALADLLRRQPPATAVLDAATAVDVLWEELKPS
jgi:hypothetical protein